MSLKNSISVINTFDRDIDWLFDFTQDFNNRKKWDKQTLEINFIGDCIELKKGTRVYTKSIEGITMETEYLTFKSPNEISIKMINTSPIFRDFIGTRKTLNCRGQSILVILVQLMLTTYKKILLKNPKT